MVISGMILIDEWSTSSTGTTMHDPTMSWGTDLSDSPDDLSLIPGSNQLLNELLCLAMSPKYNLDYE